MQEGLESHPVVIFWTIWKETNRKTFKNAEQPVQSLKTSFLRGLLSWVRMCIREGLMPLVDFVDWVWSRWGRASLFVFPPPSYGFWYPLYMTCIPWCIVFSYKYILYNSYLSKKKKILYNSLCLLIKKRKKIFIVISIMCSFFEQYNELFKTYTLFSVFLFLLENTAWFSTRWKIPGGSW